MEPPPLPTSSRFRLRVQIYGPQDAHNLSATPLRQFTIVKNPTLPLPDLTMQQLCDEVVRRFNATYPNEQLFAIDNPQDSYGFDLYLGDRIRDVFEDNEVFRIIKGASYRASVEPHRARSSSVQLNSFIGDKRKDVSHSDSFGDAEMYRRTSYIDPDRPVRSKEPVMAEPFVASPARDSLKIAKGTDSQAVTMNQKQSLQHNEIVHVRSSASNVNQKTPVNSSESRITDRYSSNLATNSTASLQHVNSPLSFGSSPKDNIMTNGSNAQKATSSLKRRREFVDELEDQNRGRSASTAMTTPLSVPQNKDKHSPMNDPKRLKRPNPGMTEMGLETRRPSNPPPRPDIYEVIETDYENNNVKPIRQNKSSNANAHVGVSFAKFRLRSSNTPSSDNGSSSHRTSASSERQRAGNVEQQRRERAEQIRLKEEHDRGKASAKQQSEAGQRRLIPKDSEEGRLAQEKDERERRAKVDADRTRRERRLRDEDAMRREVEQDINGDRHAEVKALARRDATATGAESENVVQIERLADVGARRRAEISSTKKSAESSKLYEQEHVQPRHENAGNSNMTKNLIRESVPHPNGMLPRAVAVYESELAAKAPSRESSSSAASSSVQIGTSNSKTSCTPFLPRGRLSGLSPTVHFSSQAAEGSSHKTPSPNVGLEAQMPLPPRRVAFEETPTSTSRRSGSIGGTMKQTTLVPPRLGISDIKITPKRILPKETIGGLRSSNSSLKGKAKVVESPGKQPSPAIVISDDEGAHSDSTEVYRYANFKDSRPAGWADEKGDPWQLTTHIESGREVDNSKSAASAKQKIVSLHMSPVNSTSTHIGTGVHSHTSRTEPTSQMSLCVTGPISHMKQGSSPTLARFSAVKMSYDGSQHGSSTHTHGSVQVVDSLASQEVPQEASIFQENDASNEEDSDSSYQDSGDCSDGQPEKGSEENFEDQVGDTDNLEDNSKDPEQDSEHEVINEGLEIGFNDIGQNKESKFGGLEADSRNASYKPRSNGHEEVIKEQHEKAAKESENEHSDVSDQSDTDSEESERDTTQKQLDKQLTQSAQNLPTWRQPPFRSRWNKVFPKQNIEAMDAGPKLPSLNRNLRELKQTNLVNVEASKVRNLATAQHVQDDAVDQSELDDSSERDSTEDESSSSSEDAAEAGDKEGAKIRKELSSKIEGLDRTSSSLPETHVSVPHPTYPRKETRILPPQKQIPQKIGFVKLGQQFATKRP